MQADTSTTGYFGVYVPSEQQIPEIDGATKVFFDKNEALKEVKKYKKARFKSFNYYHEALEFALYGSEHPNNNSVEVVAPTVQHKPEHPGERPSQFRGPKSQDLVKFRKAIESGDYNVVHNTVWENPRYLISSGDTPAILQEGSRYNALHVAAKFKNAKMCELILMTVSSSSFIQLLYGEENKANSEDACRILLDLYLNTPDKGLNETPLHFAVKFGALDVVEVLVSYPECNKNVLNKFQQLPRDIICSRIPTNLELTNKICLLLEDRYYVPVLRSEDNCVQPSIGDPFSPSSPPELNKNPIDPRMEIHAYAGPMKREEALQFRRKWKTPPRTPSTPKVKFGSSFCRTPDHSLSYRLQDTEKGLERVGRELAKQYHVGWKEYWPFLGTFVDLTSEEGLKQLEEYIQKQHNIAYNDSINTEEKNLSTTRSSIVSPMSDLCKNFEACTLSENGIISKKEVRLKNNLNRFNETVLDVLSKSGLSPFLCIEKSCQVFANRIANHIMFLGDNKNNCEAFETEIKHLKSLIGSYMSDIRFNIINFQSVHWRIGNLVAQKLKELFMYDDEINIKRDALENIIKNYNKLADVFSSDDEELNSYRQNEKPLRRKSTSNNRQVICVIENILKALEGEMESENVMSEEECVRVWKNALICECVWKTLSKSRKNSFMKKGKYKNCRNNRSLDNVSRRLSFIEDEMDEPDSKGDNIQTNGVCEKSSLQRSNSSLGLDSSSSSEDDVFLDALSEPVSTDSDTETETDLETFEDPQTDVEIFIEGNSPSKIDYAVFTALREVDLDKAVYPHIYRWRHAISLFSDDDRKSWPSPSVTKSSYLDRTGSMLTSTPRLLPTATTFTPPSSWVRVTGTNSPIRSLRSVKNARDLRLSQY